MRAVLFDLDGTLLPMDQDEFVSSYFILLSKKMSSFGYEPNVLIDAMVHATDAMVNNNGLRTNESVFWADYTKTVGGNALSHKSLFEDFYKNEFQKARLSCGFNPLAMEIVHRAKAKGNRVVLATNPIFPAIATESRIRWAGLRPDDFEFYTSYENYSYCKPNLNYYRQVLKKMGLNARDCVMVGNDVIEDAIPPDQLGMQVFLVTDCLINTIGKKISDFPQGNFNDLQAFLGV